MAKKKTSPVVVPESMPEPEPIVTIEIPPAHNGEPVELEAPAEPSVPPVEALPPEPPARTGHPQPKFAGLLHDPDCIVALDRDERGLFVTFEGLRYEHVSETADGRWVYRRS